MDLPPTPPRVSDMLQYFETILPLVESDGNAGELLSHQQGSPSWPSSWILRRIINQVKAAKNNT